MGWSDFFTTLGKGFREGALARSGNLSYTLDNPDQIKTVKDAEQFSKRWHRRAVEEVVGLATTGAGRVLSGLRSTANVVSIGSKLAGKTQPLLGMNKSLPAIVNSERALVPTTTNVVSRGMYLPGKTQPLLGMNKSLPAIVNSERALVPTTTNVVSRGSKLAKGVAGTVALGTAVGQGMSEPAQRKVSLGSPKNSSKLPYNKYNLSTYRRLVQLQTKFGGHLIRQKDGSYFLRNQYGSFYGNGRALNAKTGKMQNYDLWGSGHFINSNSKLVGNNDVVARVTDSNYLYGYTGKSLPEANTSTNLTRLNNTAEGKRIMAWLRKLGVKADGWWGRNTTAAYKAYVAKLNANKSSLPQTTLVTKPIQGTPGYEMHVGTNGVTLSTPNGQTTDVTKYKDGLLSAAINNDNYKAPNLGTLSTTSIYDTSVDAISGTMPTTHNFTRGLIKLGMSEQGLDPSNYNRSTIKAVRNFTNNPTMDNYNDKVAKVIGDARVQLRMTNQYASEMALNHSLQAPKLNIPDNLLVSYKKQGGMLVNKYQQGGATSDPMDLLAQVAAKFLQGDAQSGQQLAQVFSDQKVGKQLMQAVQQGVQQKDKRAIIIAQAIQALSGSRKARLGAKLNYFHKDICPAGEKLVYFKKGGEICKACLKMDMGGEMADDQRKAKPSLNKKPQNKPIQNKQKINLKPNNKRPGPKDLKSLPNGKYPVYWTADLRGQWDRDHDEGV